MAYIKVRTADGQHSNSPSHSDITMFKLKPGKAAGRRSSRLYHTHRGLTGFQSVKVHVAHEPGTLQCLMGSNKGDENEMWVWQEVGRHTAPQAEP